MTCLETPLMCCFSWEKSLSWGGRKVWKYQRR